MVSRRTLLLASPAALILPTGGQTLIAATDAATCLPSSLPQNYLGLGDIYGPALGYWGLRAVSSAYAAAGGPAIQLQRAWDNATKDIHVLSSGLLDVATATKFLSGTNGGVSIWYDQSGNGCHHKQPHQPLQPQFAFNAVGSNPGVTFIAGGGTFLENAAGISDTVAPVTFSHYVRPQMAATRNIDYMIFDSANGGNQCYQVDGFGAANLWAFFWSNNIVPARNNAWHSVQLKLSIGQSASNIYFDGTPNFETFSISSQTKVLSGPNSIGCDISGAGGPYQEYFNGLIAEIGVFPIAATLSQMAAAASNQATYCGAVASGQTI